MEKKIQLENGKMYLVDSRYGFKKYVVKVKENKLPEYRFSCAEAFELVNGILIPSNVFSREVWKDNGIAYHYDCYCNLISEYK